MNQPRALSMGEPSYLMAASTSGNVRPTALTAANESAWRFVTFGVIACVMFAYNRGG